MMRFLSFLGVLLLLFFGCSTTQIQHTQPKNKNFIYLYTPNNAIPYPKVVIYNTDAENSTVSLRFAKQVLSFFHNQSLDTKICKLKIVATVIPSFKNQLLLDSLKQEIVFREDTAQTFYKANIQVHTPTQYTHFIVTLKITNLFTKKSFYNFYLIDKSSIDSPQNFVLFDTNKTKLFTHTQAIGNSIIVHHQQEKKYPDLFISYQAKKYPEASLPYSLESYRKPIFNADTIIKSNFGQPIVFDKKGLYLLQTDTLSDKGYLILVTEPQFPLIKTPEKLLQPLRYITSVKEYSSLLHSENNKTAVDAFWLQVGKNTARAQILIRAYYNRVLLSNLVFTSIKEGWKTDRGMIYIIFGRPKYVYRSENLEKWIYGDPSTEAFLSFLFERRPNKLGDDCWILDRQDSYETPWYQAVRIWREGHIYSVF